MSLTLIVWLALFGLFSILMFVRASWGVALYMLSFFACPPFWWWGNDSSIGSIRWNFYAGIGLLLAVIVSQITRGSKRKSSKWSSRVLWSSLFILVNATVVHIAFAPNITVSSGPYFLLAKFVLLFWLLLLTIHDKKDFQIVILSMVIGAAYIGYETTINERGKLDGNRLEGVGAPGAGSANELACLMVTVMPLIGTIFIGGNRVTRMLMLPVAPMIVNVILLCNSRGAFLAAISGGIVFVLVAPAKVRKQALYVFGLGIVTTWFMLGDQRIVDRFMTTFASAEELDNSSAERKVYWQAGVNVIADHPLGSGGDGFSKIHASKYLKELDRDIEHRSVHQGFINEACEWGVQGFLLRLAFVGFALIIFISVSSQCSRDGSISDAMIGCALSASMTGFLITSLFGDFLDAEWGYWLVALAIGYMKVYARTDSSVAIHTPHRSSNMNGMNDHFGHN